MNKKLLTNEELVVDFKHDWFSNLRDRCYGIMSDPKYRKYILNNVKNNQRHYFKPVKLEENGNTYILQIDTKGRSDYKKNGLLFIIYRLYTRKEGTYAMMQYYSRNRPNEDRYCIFPPHLFERYRERVLKDKNLPEEDTIFKFLQNDNGTFKNIPKYHEKHIDSLFCVTTEGVMLGKKLNDTIMIAKTYISYEMLKGSQIDDREIVLEWLLEYIKNVQ